MSLVTLAFAPQSSFPTPIFGHGLAGSYWPDVLETLVPIHQFKRSVYLLIETLPYAADWGVEGMLNFKSGGQIKSSVPFQFGFDGPHPRYFPVFDTSGNGVGNNAIRTVFGPLGSNQYVLYPQIYICECDTISFEHNNRKASAGEPVWFFAVKSEAYW